MRVQDFEYMLLYHCAPTIYGVKSAGLFSVPHLTELERSQAEAFCADAFGEYGPKIRVICSCERNTLFYVYNERLLSERLADPETIRFLSERGYGGCSVCEDFLDVLSQKLARKNGFPHEIGVFLDYPLEDVIGFIKNEGHGFIMNGYWKVYGDSEKAARRFASFTQCRRSALSKLEGGMSFDEILKSA